MKKEKDSHHHRKRFSLVKTAVDLAVDYTDLADGESYEEAEDASTVEVQHTKDENSSAETNMVETTIEENYLSDEAIAENGTLAYDFTYLSRSVYMSINHSCCFPSQDIYVATFLTCRWCPGIPL